MCKSMHSNFPINLIKGEIKLWKAYWLFGIVGNIIFSLLILFVTSSTYINIFFTVISIIYYIITLIGRWNSASNYNGFKLWPILAKIIVIFSILGTLSQFNE